MLVLSRKPGEVIRVGDNITITIVRIGPNTVRLGISCPKDIPVVRSEIDVNSGEVNKRKPPMPGIEPPEKSAIPGFSKFPFTPFLKDQP